MIFCAFANNSAVHKKRRIVLRSTEFLKEAQNMFCALTKAQNIKYGNCKYYSSKNQGPGPLLSDGKSD
jgi:hypothetical protein